ncbi:MAG: EAL domain-containing protein [Gammaproteobacteria bacterium]
MVDQDPPPKRFLSLKWKALVSTTLVLLTVTGSYTLVNDWGLKRRFEQRRTADQARYAQIMQGLLDRSSKRMQQLAAALASLPEIRRHIDANGPAGAARPFDALASGLAIDLGLHGIAIYSARLEPLAVRGWEPQHLRAAAIERVVAESLRAEVPQTLYDCSELCLQLSVTPVLGMAGQAGAIVLGVSLADVILDFQRVSGADMGLIAPLPSAGSADPEGEDRVLSAWGQRVIALSNLRRNLAVLRTMAGRNPALAQASGPHYETVEGRTFEVALVPLAGANTAHEAHLVVVADVTEAVREIRDMTRGNLAIGVASLLISETLLLLILWRPVSRLRRASTSLPLLARSAFAQARAGLAASGSRRGPQDEVDVLNTAAIQLSTQLETLHGELAQRGHELAERVTELAHERDFVTQVLYTAQIIILTQDRDQGIVMVNPYTASITGYTPGEIQGRTFSGLLVAANAPDDPGRYAQLISGEVQHFKEERELRCKDGSTLIVIWHHSLLRGSDASSPAVLSVGTDITARKRAELRLAWLADHDPLTGLFNRRRLQEELAESLAQARRYRRSGALMFLDIDQFKYVNDTSGHPAGDRLLAQLAESLPRVLREVDIMGRLGGDEFAILLAQSSEQDAIHVATKVLHHIHALELRVAERVHRVSASIGIAMFPQHGDNMEDLLAHADLAMYRAKETGRGRWHLFSPDDQSHRLMQERVLWKQRVESALAEQRFLLCVQPIVDIRSGVTSHYEALLRMRAGDGSLFSPADFIEVAERSGLIGEIDRLVLLQCAQWIARLERGGRRVTISANLSAHAFDNPALLPFIQRVIYETGIDPAQLILEITETAAVSDFTAARRLIEAIRALGCSFALDDFGRGFASFYYLKELPMEYVKIDGSFIRGLTQRPDDQALVRAMADIAHAFGKKTVAEHVETQEVLTLLGRLGIDYAQGYFTGRPIEIAEAFAQPAAERAVAAER